MIEITSVLRERDNVLRVFIHQMIRSGWQIIIKPIPIKNSA